VEKAFEGSKTSSFSETDTPTEQNYTLKNCIGWKIRTIHPHHFQVATGQSPKIHESTEHHSMRGIQNVVFSTVASFHTECFICNHALQQCRVNIIQEHNT
jgi:hypothetical protein